MLRTLLIIPPCALFLLCLPQRSLAQSISTDSTYASPCATLIGRDQYRCRRREAMSQVRATTEGYWRETALQQKGFQLELRDRYKSFYLGKTTQAERDTFREGHEKTRLELFDKWHNEWRELVQARRNLRYLTRLPDQMNLRLDLIEQKGERINSRKGVKESGRIIRQRHLDFIKKYKTLP